MCIRDRCLSVHVNDWPFRINDCMKVQLIVRLYANCIIVCLKYAVDYKVCNRLSIGVNDWPLREIESIFAAFDCPKVQLLFPLMQLNVNTYANSIIESSFTLMKFMEVLMNVYLRYSFNYWRKWLCILLKWTAKGVVAKEIK